MKIPLTPMSNGTNGEGEPAAAALCGAPVGAHLGAEPKDNLPWAPDPEGVRRPPWLKVKLETQGNFAEIREMMNDLSLNTVCQEARCPNIYECWGHRTATFMILGDICTRHCAFCAVTKGLSLIHI